MKKSSIVNEATRVNSNEENFNQLWQGIKELKETLHKLTNIQNEKLDKLTKITQNLETLPQRYTFRELLNKTLNVSGYLHLNNKLPEAKSIHKCVNFICWNAFYVLNIWLLAQQCKSMLPT